ncbi:hypothetical protein BDF14DRAFT_1809082 [Spinellus fusiger]|nr:hypothetical protein BDF14DRAFT_1809082 [Spinellus fusiger]
MFLFESEAKVREVLREYYKTTLYEEWNISTIVKSLLDQFEVLVVEDDLEALSNLFEETLVNLSQEEITTDKKEQLLNLSQKINQVIKSPHIRQIFSYKLLKSNILASATDSVVKDHNCYQDSDQKISPLMFLIKRYAKDGILDFEDVRFSQRHRKIVGAVLDGLNLSLLLAVTPMEWSVLRELGQSKSMNKVKELVGKLYQNYDCEEGVKYIRCALVTMIDLWESDRLRTARNNESWFRSNVYAGVWDRLFLPNDQFYSKRAECHSAVFRELKSLGHDVKNMKVDFILRDINSNQDFITTEEKPTNTGAAEDVIKSKALQQETLALWRDQIGCDKLAKHLEAITCQWVGTELIIRGTKIIGRTMVSYVKARCTIPIAHCNEEINFYESSRSLLLFLSLKRAVTLNYEKLKAIINTKYKFELDNLYISSDHHTLRTKPDSCPNSEEEEPELVAYIHKYGPEFEKHCLSALDYVKYPLNVKTGLQLEDLINIPIDKKQKKA